MVKCIALCLSGQSCKNNAKRNSVYCHCHHRDTDSPADPIVIHILRGEGKEDDVFETSRERLLKHSGHMRTLFEDGKEEFLPSNDCVYTIDNIAIETKYLTHIMNYINTGDFQISEKDNRNKDFIKKMEQACGYFDVDIVPEEVYFLYDPACPSNVTREGYEDDDVIYVSPMIRIYNPEGVDDWIYPDTYQYSDKTETLQQKDYVPRLLDTFSRGKVPEFKFPSQVVGACGIDEYIYVIYTLSQMPITTTIHNYYDISKDKIWVIPKVARYSTSTKTWEYDLSQRNNVPDDVFLSTMEGGGGVVVVDASIYVISGASTMVYDTMTDLWSKVEKPPGCDDTLDGTVCVVDKDIFLFCGKNYMSGSDYRYNRSILKYSTLTNTWTTLECKMPTDSGAGIRSCLLNGMIYITGFGKYSEKSVRCFDPLTETFMNHSKTIENEGYGTMFVLNGGLYIVDSLRRTQWYCTASKSWRRSNMIDVCGVLGVVMKGGGELAKGDKNWFTLRKASLQHQEDEKNRRVQDKKRMKAIIQRKREHEEEMNKMMQNIKDVERRNLYSDLIIGR
jgi:hypothetical protein